MADKNPAGDSAHSHALDRSQQSGTEAQTGDKINNEILAAQMQDSKNLQAQSGTSKIDGFTEELTLDASTNIYTTHLGRGQNPDGPLARMGVSLPDEPQDAPILGRGQNPDGPLARMGVSLPDEPQDAPILGRGQNPDGPLAKMGVSLPDEPQDAPILGRGQNPDGPLARMGISLPDEPQDAPILGRGQNPDGPLARMGVSLPDEPQDNDEPEDK